MVTMFIRPVSLLELIMVVVFVRLSKKIRVVIITRHCLRTVGCFIGLMIHVLVSRSQILKQGNAAALMAKF